MHIHGIDHMELYVGDAPQAAHLLCAAFGFRIHGHGGPETGLDGQRTVLVGQGGIRILLTSGLTAGHPASEYVARHGDGVAVVAFGCDDVETAFSSAVAGGARPLTPPAAYRRDGVRVRTAVVSGFGDVVHRLVERDGPRREFLPGAIQPAAGTPRGTGDDDLLGLIDHVAACVPVGELAPTVRYYREAFGLSEIFHEYIDMGEQGIESWVVQGDENGATLTFIQSNPSRQAGQIDDFLGWHGGAGVQHVAFRTADIVTAVQALTGRGVGFAVTPGSYYDLLEARLGQVDLPVGQLREQGVLVDRDPFGQLFQIFTRSMHVRRTLFFELIERHGARTFGTSNIAALYQAKERELARARDTVDAGA